MVEVTISEAFELPGVVFDVICEACGFVVFLRMMGGEMMGGDLAAGFAAVLEGDRVTVLAAGFGDALAEGVFAADTGALPFAAVLAAVAAGLAAAGLALDRARCGATTVFFGPLTVLAARTAETDVLAAGVLVAAVFRITGVLSADDFDGDRLAAAAADLNFCRPLASDFCGCFELGLFRLLLTV